MCGLYGWVWNTRLISPAQRATMATVLMVEMASRGRQSWGWFDPDVGVTMRGLGSVLRGVDVPSYHARASVAAHTRAPSTGEVTVENAHPFEFGRIMGAHNGVVSNHVELNAKHERKHAVDSMHIFDHLNRDMPLADIEAWGAVWWHDKRSPERIWLSRFHGGVLNVAIIAGKNGAHAGTIWASTSTAVDYAATMAGLDAQTKEVKIENNQTYYVTKDGVFDAERAIGISEKPMPVYQPVVSTHTPAPHMAAGRMQVWRNGEWGTGPETTQPPAPQSTAPPPLTKAERKRAKKEAVRTHILNADGACMACARAPLRLHCMQCQCSACWLGGYWAASGYDNGERLLACCRRAEMGLMCSHRASAALQARGG